MEGLAGEEESERREDEVAGGVSQSGWVLRREEEDVTHPALISSTAATLSRG